MCTDYQKALEIIRNIFIISLFEYEDQSVSGEENVSSGAKDFLLGKISGSKAGVKEVSSTLEDDSQVAVFKRKNITYSSC